MARTVAKKGAGKSPASKISKVSRKAAQPHTECWQVLYENAPVGICRVSDTGQILEANQALFTLLQYKPEQLRRLNLRDITFPADAQDVWQSFTEVIRDKHLCLEWEKRFLRKDGEPVWGATYASWVENKEANSSFVLLMIVDTTERKSLQEALQRNAAFRKAVLDFAAEGVCVCHPIDAFPFVEFTAFNRKAEELTGFTMEELNRYGWMVLFPEPDIQKRAVERISRIWVGDSAVGEEWLITRKNGAKRLISLSTSIFTLGDGRVQALALMHDLTKKKAAEEDAADAHQELQVLFREARDAMFIAEPYTGIIQDVNKQAERLLKRSRNELIGTHQSLLHPPEDAESYRTLYRNQVLNMGGDPVEGEVFTGTGERIPVEIRCRMAQLPNGDRVFQGILRDITKRKKAEQALRESQQMLRAVLDTIPVRVFWKDRNLNYLGCNRVFAEDGGLADPDAVIGKSALQLRWGESAADIHAVDEEVLETGNPKLNYEEQRHDAQGNPIWARVSKIPLRNYRDEIVGILGTYEDITDQKIAELALRENQERLARIVDTCPVGIAILNSSGQITFANPIMEKIFSFPREKMIGYAYDSAQWTFTTLDGKPFPKENSASATVMRTQKPVFGVEMIMTNAQGHRVAVSINASPLPDAEGNVQNIVVAISDISERFKMEEERRYLERQMLHSQKLESLGILAGGIGHDFNNFLMAIQGNAELAKFELSPLSPAYAGLAEIERTARQAAELCRHLLTYSGKGHFSVEPIDLSNLVKDMRQVLKASVSKKAVLKYSLASDLPAVEADAGQMRQVLMNLLVNASEAIGEQRGVITITTGSMLCDAAYLGSAWGEENPVEGQYVYLDVADSGCGMDAATLSKIFDPFFTTKFIGRGVGLAAVLGIVRGQKGIIKVQSEPNQGTAVRLLFPPSSEPAQVEEPEVMAPLYRGSGVAMLVDDEESLRTLGKGMLEHLGFTALVAGNGVEAINLFRDRKDEISVVIMDLTMPQMDGVETIQEMRRLQPEVRTLLASGYKESDVAERYAGKGIDGFIQKPYELAVFSEKLQKILGEAHPQRKAEG